MPSGYTLPARGFLRFSQNRSAIRAWKIYSTREILGLFYNGGGRIDSVLWVKAACKNPIVAACSPFCSACLFALWRRLLGSKWFTKMCVPIPDI